MKRIKLCLSIFSGIILISGCSNASSQINDESSVSNELVYKIHADYPIYGSMKEMCDKADTIILGTIVDSREELINISNSSEEDIMPYMVYTVKVEQSFKGDTGKLYEFKMLGGINDGVSYTLENAIYPQNNTSYMILTTEYDDTYASLLNINQAIVECDLSTNSISFPDIGDVAINEIKEYCNTKE